MYSTSQTEQWLHSECCDGADRKKKRYINVSLLIELHLPTANKALLPKWTRKTMGQFFLFLTALEKIKYNLYRLRFSSCTVERLNDVFDLSLRGLKGVFLHVTGTTVKLARVQPTVVPSRCSFTCGI